MSAVAARILAVPSFMADPALLKCASARGHTETLNYQYAADPSQLAATRTRRPSLAAFFPVTMTNRLWPL